MFCRVIGEEKFPVWAYGAIGGGVLLVVLIASVIAFCRSRKHNTSGQFDKLDRTFYTI